METSKIFTGKTIDVAVESALQELGLDRDSVSVTVLEQAKSGFLGIGRTDAKIQVTYDAPEETPAAPKVALSSASRSKPKAKPAAAKTEMPKAAAPKAPAPKAEPPRTEAPKAEKQPELKEAKPAAPKEPRVYTAAAPGSNEEKIEAFLKGLLEKMGSDAVPHAWLESEECYRVDLTGDDLGYLIGRRGETLDALQHLANYSINRTLDGHVRINVDAEDYRGKREESLRRYARKKAQQVLKNRRRTTLEPMNAYERHVIHAALQEMDNITTHSTGTEPNRRVVIEYLR